MALFTCLASNPVCLPPRLTADWPRLRDDLVGIAEQESRFWPWAVRDETTGESLFPPTRAAAEAQVTARLAQGHTLGAGMFQITGQTNWTRHGLTRPLLLDPCANMAAGAAHYADDLNAAALRRYNGGTRGMAGMIPATNAYAASVMQRSARLAPLLAPAPTVALSPSRPATPTTVDFGRSRAGRELVYGRSQQE